MHSLYAEGTEALDAVAKTAEKMLRDLPEAQK